ncbi:MAG: tRNA lysidine(34) synthetase TilS [Oscillospiraceae bacterium]|nr:tRNA lysidine(34) synthetase TilS [Oscillospiraceae bacterium]
MRDKVLRFCLEQGLFSGGGRVTCAVSGGADSMAMLCCLLSLRQELGITVSAAHFHHGLRAAEADRDEEFVRDFCAAHGVPLVVGRGDVAAYAAERKLSVETAARELRYRFLLGCGGRIATGHTADDNAETVLLNLTRGAGIRGLAGIPPKRDRLVRPLLCVTRTEILSFLTAEQLSWREDGSNESDEYRRNRLRHHVLPLLRQENPALSETLLTQSLLLRAEDDYLEGETAETVSRLRRDGGYDCAAFRALPEAMQRRVIRQVVSADARHTEAVREMLCAESPTGRRDLPGGVRVLRAYGLFRTETELPPIWQARRLSVPGQTRLPELSLSVRAELLENPPHFSSDRNTYLLNYAMIDGEITLRPRRTGDMFVLPGGRKSLKRLMIDRKIPASQRGSLPVLAMGNRVLAVCGVGVSREYLPRPGSALLLVRFEEQKEKRGVPSL